MQVQMILMGGFIIAFGMTLFFARKCGSKEARLQVLKEELKKQAKEQERAKQIVNNVYALSDDEARRRLHDVANKQQHRMQ